MIHNIENININLSQPIITRISYFELDFIKKILIQRAFECYRNLIDFINRITERSFLTRYLTERLLSNCDSKVTTVKQQLLLAVFMTSVNKQLSSQYYLVLKKRYPLHGNKLHLRYQIVFHSYFATILKLSSSFD